MINKQKNYNKYIKNNKNKTNNYKKFKIKIKKMNVDNSKIS